MRTPAARAQLSHNHLKARFSMEIGNLSTQTRIILNQIEFVLFLKRFLRRLDEKHNDGFLIINICRFCPSRNRKTSLKNEGG